MSDDLDLGDGPGSFDQERTRHERVKRQERELKLAITRGQYLERAHVQQATATALAVLAQTLRSIRDNLERRMGLEPAVLEAVDEEVNGALGVAAESFKRLAGE